MSEPREQQDNFCLHLINNTNSAEILPWLQNLNGIRTIGELGTREESIELITEVFEAGAIQVFAVEIDREDDEENTGKLCIELPDDPSFRKRVLDWTGHIAEEQGYEQEADVGQKYIFVMLD
jgi:hypothetical protein